MRIGNWLRIAICVVIGLAFGSGAGYATWIVGAISESPLMAARHGRHSDSFTTVFFEIGRLGAVEEFAGRCGGKVDRQRILASEDNATREIQDTAAGAGLNPPLDVARARLAIRGAIRAEKQNDILLKTRSEDAAQEFLERAGWKDPSAAHMREIVAQLDAEGDSCSTTATKGGQPK